VPNAHHPAWTKPQALSSLASSARSRAAALNSWRSCSLPEDVNGNVSMTCRHYGISQPV
jgi:hypothetical protein